MGKRTRFRLIVVGFALAQGASEATAQLPFTAPGALREHGFVTHRDAPAPPLTREDSDPRSTLYHDRVPSRGVADGWSVRRFQASAGSIRRPRRAAR